MQHRAWLVDLDGTLYRPRPVKGSMALELALCAPRSIPLLRAFRHEHELLRRELVERVESPFRLQLERAADQAGVPVERLERVVDEWMIRRPGKWLRRFRRRDLLEEIRAFRAAGGCSALVSDYPATEKLRAIGALGLFDVIVANGEPHGPGRLKPWPDGLLAAAERLGVEPAECLMIGDRPDADGRAAERASMEFRRVP